MALSPVSNRTPDLIRAVLHCLEETWEETNENGRHYPYRKAGVILMDLTAERSAQGHLFVPPRPKLDRIMGVVDSVNQRFGKRAVVFATQGGTRRKADGEAETGHAWAMRRAMRSPCYTTRVTDLAVARA